MAGCGHFNKGGPCVLAAARCSYAMPVISLIVVVSGE